MLNRFLVALSQKSAWTWVLVTLACLPALLEGVELDDLFLQAMALEGGDFVTSSFTFATGADRAQHLADADLPWWTARGFALDLFRPVAGLTHWIDWSLWPKSPLAMHLHSLLWYAALVAVVAALHRGAGRDTRAVLATLVFALSQAHGMNIGWIAARNSLIGATFAGLSLLMFTRGRDTKTQAVLSPVFLAIALLANEGAVAVLGYLVAHAVFVDEAPNELRATLRRLAPHLAVVLAWRLCTGWLGYGASQSGIYVEPSSDPLTYLVRTIVHGVLMLAGRLGLAGVDALGLVPHGYTLVFPFAAVFVALMSVLVWRTGRNDPSVRVWGVGTLLALATAGAQIPTDRGMLILGLGGSFILAHLIVQGSRAEAPRARRWLAVALVVVHIVLSPLLLALRVRSPSYVQATVQPIAAALPRARDLEQQTIIMLNVPSDLVMLYTRVMQRLAGEPEPARITYLYAGRSPVVVRRPSADVLVLEPTTPWLHAPLDRMFTNRAFAPDERVATPCFDAVVEATDAAARPTRVRFELHTNSDARRGCEPLFMAWDGDRPRPVALSAVGESLELPAPASH